MRKTGALLLAFLLGGLASVGAAPQTAYYYPCGIQAGVSNRVVVGGLGLQGVQGAWVSGTGVEVVSIVKVPGFPTQGGGEGEVQWVSQWLNGVWEGRLSKPLLPNFKQLRTWRRCSWWDTLDERDPVELSIVARDIHVPRNPLQTSPALAQLLVLSITAKPDATPGRRDIVLYDDRGASVAHPFYVSKEPHAAEALFAPPDCRVPDTRVFEPPVVLDGQIMPGETDSFKLRLRKGQRVRFLLTGRELLPYIGDAVPGFFNPVVRLADAAGREVGVADDFCFLPDPVLDCTIPEEGVYTLEVHDNLFRGRADFVYSVTCLLDDGTLPEVLPEERAFVGFPRAQAYAPPAEDTVPLHRTGTVDCPGRTVYYDVDVAAPGRWRFALYARRMGSPLDGRITLHPLAADRPRSRVRPLAVWDDVKDRLYAGTVPQAECDPVGTYEFTAPGRYRVGVSDAGGTGGAGHFFTLVAGPVKPSFEVYSMTSSFLLHPNDRSAVAFKARLVRRDGFAGAVRFDDTDDFVFEQGTIPAGADEAEIRAVPRARDWLGMKTVQFTARAVEAPSDGASAVPVTPADEYQQAFAYPHLVPSTGFHVFMHKPTAAHYDLPEWIPMPADRLFPKRVVLPVKEFPKKANAAAIEAVFDVDTVPVVPMPADDDEGVLATKMAASAAHLQNVREVVMREPENGKVNPAVYPRCVLGGVTRLVQGGLRYADGDALRVRHFARAASCNADDDVLVFVPADDPAPLSGPTGALARRLRDAGYAIGFVTEKTFPVEPRASRFRTIVLPKLRKPLGPDFAAWLDNARTNAKWNVIHEESLAKKNGWSVPGRREPFAALGKVRFARFRGAEGAWYYLHNPTKRPISGGWNFTQGGVRTVVAMTVSDGATTLLKNPEGKGYAYTLKAGDSAWVLLSGRDLTQPRELLPHPGHGGGKACNTCHDAPRRR